jgi:hypothetical protein
MATSDDALTYLMSYGHFEDETTVIPVIRLDVPSISPIAVSIASSGSADRVDAAGMLRRRLIMMISMAGDTDILNVGGLLNEYLQRFDNQFPSLTPHLGNGSLSPGDKIMGNGAGSLASGVGGGTTFDSPKPRIVDLSDGDGCVQAVSRLSQLPTISDEASLEEFRTILEAVRKLLTVSESSHKAFGRSNGCEAIAGVLVKIRATSALIWEDIFETVELACKFTGARPISKKHVSIFAEESCRQGTPKIATEVDYYGADP